MAVMDSVRTDSRPLPRPPRVLPFLDPLSREQCEQIHLAVLEVLERVGVNVFHEEALELLVRAGASVEGERARIPSWLLKRALLTAPERVRVCDRSGHPVLFLEKGRSYFGSGSDTQFVFDVQNGRRRQALKSDCAAAARVADALPHIDFVMSLGVPSDVPPADVYLHEFEAMVLHTGKPILYTAHDRRDVLDILDMAEAVAGGGTQTEAQAQAALEAHPFLILYAQPSSPLQHSREALGKLLLCADRRLPFQYVSAVMLGGTAPVTVAGAMVQVLAEVLSGLVIHQLKAPGAPFIAGGAAPQMDMRTSLCSYGSPELQLSCSIMAAMARYYGLPVFTTAGCSDAQVFDQQAGMEAGYSVVVQALAGSNLIHDLGYVGAGMSGCLEMLVLGDEAAAIARYLLMGVELSSEALAVEVIERVGPGGNFIAEEHTVARFRSSLHFATVANRLEHARWQERGGLDYREAANGRIREILERHRPPDLPAAVVDRIRGVTARRDHETASA